MNAYPECLACRANAGELIAPGGVIYQDKHWRLEHSLSPAPLAGWLILRPLRHCEGLEELTGAEAHALGSLLRRACTALKAVCGAEKIYAVFLGEAVAHLHIHLIPRSVDLPMELRGVHVFDLLQQASQGNGIPDGTAATTAEAVRQHFKAFEELSL